jgi:hypothetical protein
MIPGFSYDNYFLLRIISDMLGTIPEFLQDFIRNGRRAVELIAVDRTEVLRQFRHALSTGSRGPVCVLRSGWTNRVRFE